MEFGSPATSEAPVNPAVYRTLEKEIAERRGSDQAQRIARRVEEDRPVLDRIRRGRPVNN